jgi:CHAT domain-containing protein/tetratricopeptide (TPR) repeat protein
VKVLYTAFIVLITFGSFGQQSGSAKLEQALTFYKQGQFDSALYHLSKSSPSSEVTLTIAEILWKKGELSTSLDELNLFIERTNDPKLLQRATLLKGKVLFSIGEPVASIALMDSLFPFLDRPRDLTEALNTKSKSLIWAGEVNTAKVENLKADSIYQSNALTDWVLLGNLSNVTGILAYFDGNFDQAISNFEKAIAAKKKVLATTHPDIISLFGNTGVMYKNKLEYDKALQYYYYELENYTKSIGEVHLYVANSYQNIGSIYYSKGEYDLSIMAFERALDIRRKLLGDDNPLTLDLYEWIGNIKAASGDHLEARVLFEKVLSGRQKHLDEISHFVSLAYYNIAEADFHLQNYEQAYNGFQKAAEIGEKVYHDKNQDQATNFNGMAMSLDELGNSVEARRLYFQALEVAIPDYEWDGNLTDAPLVTNYLRFDEVFTSYLGLARSYQRSDDIADWRVALNFVEAARLLWETHRKNFTNKSDQITLGRSVKKLADLAIKINYQLFQEVGTEQYLSSIFYWNEFVKSGTLLSTLSDQRAKEISGIPDSLLQKELRFRIQKDSIKSLIADENSSGMNLETRLFQLEMEHERFVTELEDSYPEYAEKKYGLKPLPAEDIIRSLESDNEAIVQYFVTSEHQLFASVLKRGGHDLIVMECPELENQVVELRSSLSEIDEQRFMKVSSQLFGCILKPVVEKLGGINQLTIVTDGILGYVPFELLLDASENYLLEHFLIKYDLSSTLLAQRIQKEQPAGKLLAYAPQFQGQTRESEDLMQLVRSNELVFLPGAEEEVKTINTVLDTETRFGAQATETSFKQEASSYGILHLATHSVINPRDPSYTKLIFSRDEYEDGQLHIYELENISLNASMVTLSACNTGVGKIAEGEGVMSLARSFRALGVPSVVMSLWPASDKSTPELMKYFYQNLRDGQPKDEALNNARKEYLATAKGKAIHPFYWGGFVLVGDNTPISEGRNLMAWIISFLVVVPGLLILYRRRQRRS